MPLALGDVVQVSLKGSLFGQRILNILHYSVSVVGTGTEYDQLSRLSSDIALGAAATDILTPFLSAIAPQYTLEEIRCQRVYPTRTVYAKTSVTIFGAYATGTELTNVAVSLEKRTLAPGRMGIGRLQLAGIPTAVIDNGEVTAGYQAGELAALAAILIQTITTTGPVVTFSPCLFNPTAPVNKFEPIFSIIPQSTIRVMRRRTLRIGE